jgi:hypothetical protein
MSRVPGQSTVCPQLPECHVPVFELVERQTEEFANRGGPWSEILRLAQGVGGLPVSLDRIRPEPESQLLEGGIATDLGRGADDLVLDPTGQVTAGRHGDHTTTALRRLTLVTTGLGPAPTGTSGLTPTGSPAPIVARTTTASTRVVAATT